LSELKGLRIFPKFGFFEHGNGTVSFLKSIGLFYGPIEQLATIQRKSYDVPLIHKKIDLLLSRRLRSRRRRRRRCCCLRLNLRCSCFECQRRGTEVFIRAFLLHSIGLNNIHDPERGCAYDVSFVGSTNVKLLLFQLSPIPSV
jgi:hypothetical protein